MARLSVILVVYGLAAGRTPASDRVPIPAGPFQQGSTRGEEDERPQRTTTLRSFAMDRTEVTRGDYARCVAARRCKPIPAAPASAAGIGLQRRAATQRA